MRRMVTVVKKKEVKATTRKVPGMIMIGPGICMHVLDVVEHHDDGCGRNRRKHQGKEPYVQSRPVLVVVVQVPSQPQHPKVDANPKRVLKQDAIIQLRVFLFRTADVSLYRVTLGISRNKRVSEYDEQVVQVGVSPSDGRIAGSIGKQMMIEVVSWNPHHCWITVEDRQYVTEAAIETLD